MSHSVDVRRRALLRRYRKFQAESQRILKRIQGTGGGVMGFMSEEDAAAMERLDAEMAVIAADLAQLE